MKRNLKKRPKMSLATLLIQSMKSQQIAMTRNMLIAGDEKKNESDSEQESEVDQEKHDSKNEILDEIESGKEQNEEDLTNNNDSNEDNNDDDDDGGWVEETVQETTEVVEEEEVNSPMFVPKGRFYFHDLRDDDDNNNGEKEDERKPRATPCQTADKWEHDMYDPELQKPREEWEKERDRKYYEELNRRKESGEAPGKGYRRGNRGTSLGQFMPRGERRGYRNNDSSRRDDTERDSSRRNARRSDGGSSSYYERRDNGRRETRGNRTTNEQQYPKEDRDKRTDRKEVSNRKEERKQRGSSSRQPVGHHNNSKSVNPAHKGDWDAETTNQNNSSSGRKNPTDTKIKSDDVDHTGSLFLKKDTTVENKDVFTSKIFSLSSQTNKLIVKDAPQERKKPLGRGRGRPAKTAPSANPSTSSNGQVVTNSSSPGGLGSSNRPTKPPLDTSTDEPAAVVVPSIDSIDSSEKDGILGTKPKRYSSRRQKGGLDVEDSTDKSNSTTGDDATVSMGIHHQMQPPFPLPYQWPAHFATPAPMMIDPNSIAQQQMLMMMQQQMAAFYQHQMMYPDGTPMAGPPVLIPNADVSHQPPVPPGPSHVPETSSNATVVASNGGTDSKSAGLFIPPVTPDQQRMMQSPKLPKQSQAIPIVSPKHDKDS